VAVGVEGHRDVGVAQQFLDVFRMLISHEGYCSARMAEIMQPYPR
jgi:hypothetical protein